MRRGAALAVTLVHAALVHAAALAICAAPAAARAPADPAFATLQTDDARVQSIGWRLVRANAPFCHAVPGVGLLLQDMANYRDPAAARRATGLAGDIGIEAAAAESPAARAGLQANDDLVALDGVELSTLPPAKAGDYARLTMLHDRIDAALARAGQVSLTVIRDGARHQVTLVGEPVCPTRFELVTGGGGADADGTRARISRRMMVRTGDDAELAALIAHELAHNVLHHRIRLDQSGRGWGKVKATEQEADQLSVWLIANAGYDPAAAARMIGRIGPAYDFGFLSAPDHYRWKNRAAQMNAEMPKVLAARALRGDGLADFRPAFPESTAFGNPEAVRPPAP